MKIRMTLIVLSTILIPQLLLADYWQQQVNYDLDVTLIDSLHQVTGSETITYINNSPDELSYIWMHLWPNAYKNNETALARQKFNQFSTKMHFSPDSSFGWIDISDVAVDGKQINWSYRSSDTLDVAKFNLNKPLLPGDTLEIDLNFTVQVPNVLSRLGHVGQHYEMTQWYPKPAVYDAKGWHPMSYLDMGEFYSEWGDFEVSVTVPANYRIAATGVLQDSLEIIWRDSLAHIGNALIDTLLIDPKSKIVALDTSKSLKPASSDSMKTITFKQNNVHDFAWFADKRFIISSDSVVLPSGRSIQTWTFALPKNFQNYRYSNDYIKDAVSYFSEWFIEYPYQHATVVDGDFSAGGGMEYPMITLINNTGFQPILEQVIMHEVGHNWFYGLSGSNERDYPWMDEGLVSYAENRYWAAKYSDDSMLAHDGEKPAWLPILEYFLKDPSKSAIEDYAYYMSAGIKMDQSPDLHSEAFSDYNYGMIVYKKVAVSTESLHAYLGEALMDSVWHAYYQRWTYKHPQPEDIRQVFEEISGEDLSWYFEDMLGSTRKIDYALDTFTSYSHESAYETSININNRGDFTPPLKISLSGAKTAEIKTAWVHPSGDRSTFKIETSFPVQNVVLDPDLTLLDMDRTNNDLKLNLDFDFIKLALNPQADYVVTTIPYLWYDTIDQVHPGLIITHKNLMPWGTDWYLRTFYGTKTQRAGFVASIGRKLVPRPGQEVQLHSRVVNGWYSRLAEISAGFRKRSIMLPSDDHKLTFSLLAHDLTDGEYVFNNDTTRYLDQNIWEAGQYLKVNVNYTSKNRGALWARKYEFNTLLGAQRDGKPFAKIQTYFNHRKRYSRKGSIRTTIFAGYAFGDLPTQDRFYISTEMNTTMDKKIFPSRRDTRYGAGQFLLYQTEYTIPGYTYLEESNITPNTTGLLGLKVRADIPKMESFNILMGAGLVLDQNDEELEAIGSLSPIWKSGPIQIIYTPFRLESGHIETDWSQVQIAIDMTIAGTISIGI
jgi:hypothetical protein